MSETFVAFVCFVVQKAVIHMQNYPELAVNLT